MHTSTWLLNQYIGYILHKYNLLHSDKFQKWKYFLSSEKSKKTYNLIFFKFPLFRDFKAIMWNTYNCVGVILIPTLYYNTRHMGKP